MPEQPNPVEIAATPLRDKAKITAEIPFEKLIRSDLGPASFQAAADDFRAMQAFAKRVAQCTWKGVPIQVIEDGRSKFERLMQVLEPIFNFDVMQSSNVVADQTNRLNNFRSVWRDTFTNLVTHLNYAESVDSGADRYNDVLSTALAQADAAKEKFKADLSGLDKSMQEDRQRMKTLVTEVENMAQRSGVTNQAVHFKQLADWYRLGAGLWLIASAVAGVGLFFYVKSLHFIPVTTPVELAAEILPRLVTVTLLSTALIFCLRNFASLAHNVIVNRHRQTALTTFKTFVSSTDDAATRNAVLMQATQAIFLPQPSGYLKSDTEMPQMNQVTEIVRGFTGKDK